MSAPAPVSGACPHCGAAVEGESRFCCSGCETAAAIIAEAGASSWYQDRGAAPSRPSPSHIAWDRLPVEVDEDGLATARLAVGGIRCGSCVWVIETVLSRTEGVEHAHLGYTSGALKVRFDPRRVDLPRLAGRVEGLGYSLRPADVAAPPDHDLLVRFGLAAFVAANVMGVSAAVYAGWLSGMEAHFEALFRWTTLALVTPAVLWSSVPFFAGAWAGLKHRLLHMDFPVSLAIAVMYAHGLFATLRGEDGYLDSLAMLVALLLGGRVLEARGRKRAAEAATALAAAAPSTVRRERDGRVEVIDVEALAPGDVILLAAGEEIGADGVVLDGSLDVRMALITGESEPARVGPGGRLVAGAVVMDGAGRLVVERTGRDTTLAQMAEAVARSTEAGISSPLDRIAPWFTAATLVIAGVTAAWTWQAHGLDAAMARTIAVLVVACPCALALAYPLAASAGVGAAARRGLLVRDGAALLALAEVDTLALDKTGTVTEGALEVVEAEDAVLRLAAGLERGSIHPIARAIVDAAVRRGIPLPAGLAVQEAAGVGVSGYVDGQRYSLGRGDSAGEVALRDGAGGLVGTLKLRDVARPDARAAIARLRGLGVRPVLLSGDRREVAEAIAAEVGVNTVFAEVGPLDKGAWIESEQASGRRVAFAGDGVNDGPAIGAARVGIAMGSGATSSVLAADAVVVEPALGPIVAGIRAARAAKAAIDGNVRRSIAYNIIAVTAAALGFINPLVAAVSMPISSGLVLWGAFGVERAMKEG